MLAIPIWTTSALSTASSFWEGGVDLEGIGGALDMERCPQGPFSPVEIAPASFCVIGLIWLGLPKFSSELMQRTRTSRTEPTVQFSSGSVQPLDVTVRVLGSGHGCGKRTEVWTSSNRTF